MPGAQRSATAPVTVLDADGEPVDREAQPLALFDGNDLSGERLAQITELRSAPSLAERSDELGLPVHVNTEALAGRDLIWGAWREQDARLVETGEITSGYLAIVKDMTTLRLYTVFVGGIALCRVLRQMQGKPFRATIERSGRTWVFR